MEEFLAQGRAEGWSIRTLESYRARLEYVISFLEGIGRLRVVEVKAEDLRALEGSIRAKQWKTASRQAYLNTAMLFFRLLVHRGKLLSDPTREWENERDEDEELPPPPLSVL